MQNSYDVIIVGSGIGGLSTLLYLTETDAFIHNKMRIALLAKADLTQTNTLWAQGGIAAVNLAADRLDDHIADTLVAGAGINDPYIVKKVIEAGPSCIHDLQRWQVIFDADKNGQPNLAKEGGHSAHRIWHRADETGKAIQLALLDQLKQHPQLDIICPAQVVQVKKEDSGNFSLQYYDETNQHFKTLQTQKLVLATGGLGSLYQKSTNQPLATGDGLYLANQLGAKLENLCFIQFHPTGLYNPNGSTFLISEALRGAGAVLKNKQQEAFMHLYDSRGDLAPRDIVSRSILAEMNRTQEKHVYLDATQVSSKILDSHFPTIVKTCKTALGLDVHKDPIPVISTQHYSCGGIAVNEWGGSSVTGLYAIGEVASTGLHGANRLASNSLLEAVAFGKFAAQHVVSQGINQTPFTSNTNWQTTVCKKLNRADIQAIMSNYVGIERSNTGLIKAAELLSQLGNHAPNTSKFTVTDFENTSLITVASLLVANALEQTTNKGVHYNIDLV